MNKIFWNLWVRERKWSKVLNWLDMALLLRIDAYISPDKEGSFISIQNFQIFEKMSADSYIFDYRIKLNGSLQLLTFLAGNCKSRKKSLHSPEMKTRMTLNCVLLKFLFWKKYLKLKTSNITHKDEHHFSLSKFLKIDEKTKRIISQENIPFYQTFFPKSFWKNILSHHAKQLCQLKFLQYALRPWSDKH